MQDEVKVSILIPCYNSEQWVAEAIESALLQDYRNAEVLVYDDASSDRSVEIIKGFEGVRLIQGEKNKGGNFARNILIEKASGDWLQFLDADDVLLPTKISDDIRMLSENSDADIVLSQTAFFRGEISATYEELSSNEDLWALWLSWRMPQTSGFLWRMSAIVEMDAWDTDWANCQDYEISYRALTRNLDILIRSGVGAHYRQWSDETVSKKNVLSVIQNRTSLTVSALEFLRSNGLLTDSRLRHAQRSFFEMARHLASQDLEIAAEYARKLNGAWGFCLEGPAAPWSYRMIYRLFGFEFAERFARFRRRIRG